MMDPSPHIGRPTASRLDGNLSQFKGPGHSLRGSKALELRHLRSVVMAAECGSFRQAAELLGLKQSTLSRSISRIEHGLGLTIFERSSGGVKATAAGRSVLRAFPKNVRLASLAWR